MQLTPSRRLVCLVVLLGCLVFLMGWFGSLAPAPEMGAYPDEAALGSNYGAWVGEKTSLTGEVVETDPLTVATGDGSGGHLRLRVTETDRRPSPGDRLAVFGVVESDRTIRAETAYVVPSSRYGYMYGVSFVAGLWVLGRLVRTWRFDRGMWSLKPRSESFAARRWIRNRTTEDRNA
ncbi:hypothetical protein C440_04643 [Haloferax mucosum ATCC BAA-1512]|uniref:Uncharacterized protein n=1 Tax=Haloferax mucosum ATCC BAA-1512 TaxID=662479 RepID=M0IJS6_9EURY|nr:hypothetical protein [Haloferax mucosum]ELZ97036.1 hypothetical protein C440_04643 [Haloferax mucosum ATCC BAA-1512]